MDNRAKALEIVEKNIPNKNLVKHCLCVEAAMKGLARYFNENEEKWGLAGLLHDADWEFHRARPDLHTRKTIEWMKEAGINDEVVIRTILSHNFENNGEKPPETKMEWSLYICDELTGFIIACALIRPEKKLEFVTVESVLKRMKAPSFAAAVDREQIKLCEEKLDIKLEDFIKIILTSMQGIHEEIGL